MKRTAIEINKAGVNMKYLWCCSERESKREERVFLFLPGCLWSVLSLFSHHSFLSFQTRINR
jgi:hypothetical protein